MTAVPGAAPTGDVGHPSPASPTDPLRLCVYATIAALAWWLGPFALLAFAALGLAGYLRARRAGLTRSKCVLRDTRLVLAYLAALVVAASVGIGFVVADWVR